MKKSAVLSAVLLFLLVLAGCSEPSGTSAPDASATPSASQMPAISELPSAPQTSKVDDIPFSQDQLYAVACLGYEGPGDISAYTERYLDSENLPTHYISSGEYYLIIPRYADMTMRLYRNHMETMDRTLIYEEKGSLPFIVRCNVSDIFPDVTIQLMYQSETIEFSPYISLKDGSVEVGDRGLDITVCS